MYLAVLWIRIRIGSVFRSFLDPDPDPNWAKILDPDPNLMYLDPQHCLVLSVKNILCENLNTLESSTPPPPPPSFKRNWRPSLIFFKRYG